MHFIHGEPMVNIVLGKRVRISTEGKGQWLKARLLKCLISMRKHFRNLRC